MAGKPISALLLQRWGSPSARQPSRTTRWEVYPSGLAPSVRGLELLTVTIGLVRPVRWRSRPANRPRFQSPGWWRFPRNRAEAPGNRGWIP